MSSRRDTCFATAVLFEIVVFATANRFAAFRPICTTLEIFTALITEILNIITSRFDLKIKPKAKPNLTQVDKQTKFIVRRRYGGIYASANAIDTIRVDRTLLGQRAILSDPCKRSLRVEKS
jgi:hypothetical protein